MRNRKKRKRFKQKGQSLRDLQNTSRQANTHAVGAAEETGKAERDLKTQGLKAPRSGERREHKHPRGPANSTYDELQDTHTETHRRRTFDKSQDGESLESSKGEKDRTREGLGGSVCGFLVRHSGGQRQRADIVKVLKGKELSAKHPGSSKTVPRE